MMESNNALSGKSKSKQMQSAGNKWTHAGQQNSSTTPMGSTHGCAERMSSCYRS